MLVVYDKNTKEVLQLLMVSENVPEPILEDIPSLKDVENIASFRLPNDPSFDFGRQYIVTLDEEGNPTGLALKLEPPIIELTTDAQDTDGDGLPEIPADGESKATITATIKDAEGKVLTRVKKPVTFRTTRGILSARNVTPTRGEANVTLTSILETVTATVTATAEGCRPTRFSIEFLPVG